MASPCLCRCHSAAACCRKCREIDLTDNADGKVAGASSAAKRKGCSCDCHAKSAGLGSASRDGSGEWCCHCRAPIDLTLDDSELEEPAARPGAAAHPDDSIKPEAVAHGQKTARSTSRKSTEKSTPLVPPLVTEPSSEGSTSKPGDRSSIPLSSRSTTTTTGLKSQQDQALLSEQARLEEQLRVDEQLRLDEQLHAFVEPFRKPGSRPAVPIFRFSESPKRATRLRSLKHDHRTNSPSPARKNTADAVDSEMAILMKDSEWIRIQDALQKAVDRFHQHRETQTSFDLTAAKRQMDNATKKLQNSGHLAKVSPFASLTSTKRSTSTHGAQTALIIETSLTHRSNVVSAKASAPIVTTSEYRVLITPVRSPDPDIVAVPPFTNHIGLRHSILGENSRTLMGIPLFAEADQNQAEQGLNEQNDYIVFREEDRITYLDRLQRSILWQSYIRRFLRQLNVDPDKLASLVRTHPTLQRLLGLPYDLDMSKDVKTKHIKSKSKTKVIHEYVKPFLAMGPSSSEVKTAGLIYIAVFQRCGFGLQLMFPVPSLEPPSRIFKPDREESFRSIACRICHLLCCPYHGEIIQQDEESSDEEPSFEEEDSQEIISHRSQETEFDDDAKFHYKYRNINQRKFVLAPKRRHEDTVDDITPGRRGVVRTADDWRNLSDANFDVWKRDPFYPCDHDGSCEEAQCTCFQQKIPCEKICGCSKSCQRRWTGCDCAQRPGGTCLKNSSTCPCQKLNRECNPDLCGTCGAQEATDASKRYDSLPSGCRNCNIQKVLPKRTLLGESRIQGFGVYAGEDIRKNEFIGEYNGEIISRKECERRHLIYEHRSAAYTFKLNQEQDVDGQSSGNKMRFINHSKASANCIPRMVLCNTVVRIAIEAERDIKKGQELLFDYGDEYWESRAREKAKEHTPVGTASIRTSAKTAKSTKPNQLKPMTGRKGTLGNEMKAGAQKSLTQRSKQSQSQPQPRSQPEPESQSQSQSQSQTDVDMLDAYQQDLRHFPVGHPELEIPSGSEYQGDENMEDATTLGHDSSSPLSEHGIEMELSE